LGGEAFGILQHAIHVTQGIRHERLIGLGQIRFGDQVNFRHLGTVRNCTLVESRSAMDCDQIARMPQVTQLAVAQGRPPP
jgi:hypothetical protein